MSPSALPFALLDPITYLPNRQHFIENYATNGPDGQVLLMVTLADADHYNQILRAFGHEYAENFIRAGAARIRALVPADTLLHHTSLLSFAAILKGDEEVVAEEIIEDLNTPLDCGGIPVATRVGVGIAFCKGLYGADLLRTALVAAQDSRNSGAGYAYYDAQPDNAHRRGFLLVSQLSEAMRASDQLSLVYQPKYSLPGRRAIGAEALIRWTHPQLGTISPGEFIPLVEATALINPLTDWVLEQALTQLAEWHASGFLYNIAINVSPQNLIQTRFAHKLSDAIAKHDIDPRFIELEFAEGALVGRTKAVYAQLQAVREIGVHVALNDFGTGFFNLSHITTIPADIIKIDRAFLHNVASNERNGLVLRTLIQMAHRLGYRVVADGIETADTFKLLCEWGCDEGQGFFLSAPLTKSGFAAWMPLNQPEKVHA